MTKSNILHFYTNPADGRRISFAGEYQDGILNIAAAICSTKDNFVRRKGRAIAENRLKANYVATSVAVKEMTTEVFIEEVKKIEPVLRSTLKVKL